MPSKLQLHIIKKTKPLRTSWTIEEVFGNDKSFWFSSIALEIKTLVKLGIIIIIGGKMILKENIYKPAKTPLGDWRIPKVKTRLKSPTNMFRVERAL